VLGTCEGLLLGVGPGRRHMDSGPAAATYILLYMKECGVEWGPAAIWRLSHRHTRHTSDQLGALMKISGPPVCVTAGRVGVRGGIISGGDLLLFSYMCV
jgi:hypothetical protein